MTEKAHPAETLLEKLLDGSRNTRNNWIKDQMAVAIIYALDELDEIDWVGTEGWRRFFGVKGEGAADRYDEYIQP